MLTADSARRLFAGQRAAYVYRGPRRTRHASAGADTASSLIPQIAAGGSNNTKGNYVQLTASAAIDADGFFLILDPGTVSNRNFLVDIGIGPALSEVVILADVLATYRGNGLLETYEVYVPLPIKAGTRIAARCQSSTASSTMGVGLELVSGPFYRAMRMKRAVTFGVGASSGGTSIDPGGSAGTEGAWTELVNPLPDNIEYVVMCVGNQLNTARSGGSNAIDLGVGASTAEVVVVEQAAFKMEGNRDGVSPQLRGRWVDIRKGQRLVARSVSQITSSPARLADLVVIGFSQ